MHSKVVSPPLEPVPSPADYMFPQNLHFHPRHIPPSHATAASFSADTVLTEAHIEASAVSTVLGAWGRQLILSPSLPKPQGKV